MSVLVVGSVALDSVRTPFGSADEVVGGSAVFFSAAASLFTPVQVVGVVGPDYPRDDLGFLAERGVDLDGIEITEGESFRWAGEYSYDLNSRETLDTRLGVFADFQPRIPEAFCSPRIVFLGNIHPSLQASVLDQVERPELVACDTMNFWITGARDDLEALLARVDLLMVNDEETRQLADEPNLVRAVRWIQERGPRAVVVKKGEHGAMLFHDDEIFFVPGYPLEDVRDPTGAGDSFAGGFLGYLASIGHWDAGAWRRAMVYGSVTGSFAVADFSIERFRSLTRDQVAERARLFRRLTAVEFEVADAV
ncbi:MAG: PfkB family carbohydrate kinase [Gemmatimonadota bacterium]